MEKTHPLLSIRERTHFCSFIWGTQSSRRTFFRDGEYSAMHKYNTEKGLLKIMRRYRMRRWWLRFSC